ncbi:UNVERIFIED_CONTAM: hypothetical protein Sradi_6958000 [Sesamum radiatum]|uniref:Uncharacterized protein n=1 Tax=Sesamum radiatum TaxID=300843 RepID=A0AAW2JF15_SESRA
MPSAAASGGSALAPLAPSPPSRCRVVDPAADPPQHSTSSETSMEESSPVGSRTYAPSRQKAGGSPHAASGGSSIMAWPL